MAEELVLCECHNEEHQLIIRSFPETFGLQDEVFISYHLVNKSFWDRVVYGIRYIFGYKSRYGAWDEIIVNRKKLKEILNRL